MSARRRVGLTWYSSLIAMSAYAGAVGLATGAMDTGGTINARLPFQSPVSAAVALAAIVGIPNTAVAWYAWHGDRRVRTAAVVAGVLLIGWIAVEVAVIRELSWLQPFYVAVGASLVAIGRNRRTSAVLHARGLGVQMRSEPPNSANRDSRKAVECAVPPSPEYECINRER